ncbi:hypothetical protein PspLS_10678 [Pyricularia sp. CBS 133598]|nr:hypothetical protein PspLS_10678 [Pyricularia sp. CBS 133598]
MFGLKSTLILALAAFSAAASIDSAVISRRQATSVTCGNNNYSSDQVQAAVDQGCSLFSAGNTVGRNNYPHRFNNREQLPFSISGPYQEFPILNSRVYNGGSPGADRVAFTTNNDGTCTFAGAMTHTGASGNNFVACQGNSFVSDSPKEKEEKRANSASSLSAGGVAVPIVAAVLALM